MTVDSAPVLLETKLLRPVVRPGTITRSRLTEDLATRPLTLVDAPAGWGKTTLLAHWCAAGGGDRPPAWLALDGADNDPVVFWSYVIKTLRTVEPGIGERMLDQLRAPGVNIAEVALPTLLNEGAALREPVTLVLDDFHLISNRDIHEAMTFFVEHLPPTFRLVISTRHDPPLPLARLRARGELVEIRAAELRFSRSEADILLNGVLALGLAAADVARLDERTEGWAAGLYLAALSLHGQADPSRFVATFAGNDRHVVDYLGSEVLAGESEEVRRFLLRTSILDRLCGPLCDAVTGGCDSGQMLERIEGHNQLLVALDGRRCWYRYHHLFGDLLRHELTRAEPGMVGELHRRASIWCADAGLTDEAIQHAVAAGEGAEAGELVARHWLLTTDQGRQGTVFRWLAILPGDIVSGDARLCLATAMTLLSVGRSEEARPWIEKAEETEPQGPLWDGMSSMEAEVAFARSMDRAMAGDLAPAAGAAQRALELEAGPASFWRTTLASITGAHLYLVGRGPEARALLDEGIGSDGAGGNGMSLAYALAFRAFMHMEADELEGAEWALVRAGDLLARDEGLREHFAWYAVEAATGLLRERQGDLGAADATLERATELARRGGGPAQIAFCLLIQSGIRHRRGDGTGARELVREARQLIEACPDPGAMLLARLEKLEHLLAVGDARPVPAHPPRAVPAALTEREVAVLRLLASPLSLREVGSALYVSLNTVKTHARGVYRKLGASSREEAVARARELGLL
jgi:LuxR family maltose regulon positive regulatory protein